MTMNEPGFVVRLAAAIVADAAFGVIFNRWIAQHQSRNDGIYTAFYVAGGVLFTVATAVLLIGVEQALLVLVLFAASGLPMIIGSMQRHTERIQTTNETAISEAMELLNGSQSEE
jgi:hypothetical protein